ncbi:hypothetical protein ATCC90586_009536 [Pythium insidiosum]|nr:hypothetical protein ATCC90586_009536 [Pythium insidiosum]
MPSSARIIPLPGGSSARSFLSARKSLVQSLRRATFTTNETLEFFVVLSRPWFVFVWWLILGLHVVLGLFVFGVGKVYWYISDPANYIYFTAVQVPAESLRRSGFVYFLLSALHVWNIAWMLAFSLGQQELATTHGERRQLQSVLPLRQRLSATRNPLLWLSLCHEHSSRWVTRHFGVYSQHFAVIYVAREMIELGLQTYQAYALSSSVPREWVNDLAVGAIVANALSTPLLSWLVRNRAVSTRRMACLVVDALLDLAHSVVIPFCVFMPYWLVFDPAQRYFDYEYIMDDVWYVNAVRENRQVLITSWLDFISTILPHLNLVSYLRLARTLVRRQRSMFKPGPSSSAALQSTTEQSDVPTSAPHYHRRWMLVYALFVVFGAAVLAVHIEARAKTRQTLPGCQLHLDPWFATNYSCSVVHVNCYRRQINGTVSELDVTLANLERSSVMVLVLLHCPALRVSPVVRELSRLQGFEIYNSTLIEWGDAARIEAGLSTRLSYIYFTRTHLLGLPRGVHHEHLPPSLGFLAFFFTNLTTLPEDIDKAWAGHEWDYIAVSDSGLKELPLAFARVPVRQLSLVGNALKTIDDAIFRDAAVSWLALSNNPLIRLPDVLGDTSNLWYFFAEQTNLSQIPAALESWAVQRGLEDSSWQGSLFGSPYCQHLVTSDVIRQRLCGTDYGSSAGDYPLAIMEPQREL